MFSSSQCISYVFVHFEDFTLSSIYFMDLILGC